MVFASAGITTAEMSVRLSVRHTEKNFICIVIFANPKNALFDARIGDISSIS